MGSGYNRKQLSSGMVILADSSDLARLDAALGLAQQEVQQRYAEVLRKGTTTAMEECGVIAARAATAAGLENSIAECTCQGTGLEGMPLKMLVKPFMLLLRYTSSTLCLSSPLLQEPLRGVIAGNREYFSDFFTVQAALAAELPREPSDNAPLFSLVQAYAALMPLYTDFHKRHGKALEEFLCRMERAGMN